MKKIVLVILSIVIIVGLSGAETYTLTIDQAVDLAIAQNLNLQQSGITMRSKERAKSAGWNAFLPSMAMTTGLNGLNGFFASNGLSPPVYNDPGSMTFTAGINLSLALNAGIASNIKRLITDYETGLLDYENTRKALERDVRKVFYSLIANQENIQIEEANISLAEKRLLQTQNNFLNGLVPELEVLSAEVNVSNMRPRYNNVLAGYENLLRSFKFLLGLAWNDEISLEGNLDIELYGLEAEELIPHYLPNRLDLRIIEKQITTLEHSRKSIAQSNNTPTLNLGYNYSINTSNSDMDLFASPPLLSIDPWSNWADRGTLSLMLQWKFDGLIPGSQTHVQDKETQDSLEILRLSQQMALENASIEVKNLVTSLDTARQTIEANTSSLGLARRNYELTEEAYRVGTRELLDVESAQNDYLASVQQLLLAKYEYLAGLLDLEYALNTKQKNFLDGNK